MEHENHLETLGRLFDGDLSGSEKASAESRLASCPDCTRAWAEWTRTRETLAPFRSVGLGPGFRARVMESLEDRPSEPRLVWAAYLGTAAAVALAFAVSLPSPEGEMASVDPTGLLSVASAANLPSQPIPDWATEVNP